ncbi:MAG: porin [Sterolibacteriaceae bacterium]|nr:porin [Candidatus Methylophosphatis haderslevensis]
MTRTALLVAATLIGLPVQAADRFAPSRGDALGSGLAALWREAHGDAPGADGSAGLASGLRGSALIQPAVSMRNGGLGMSPLPRVARSETMLDSGAGIAGRFSSASAAMPGLDENPPNWWSAAATFERGAWRAFAAHERAQDWLAPGASDEGWRLGAAYRFGNAQLSAGWERLRHEVDAGDARQQAWWIGFAQRVGDGALRLNFARATDVSGNLAAAPGGARQLSLGYEHGLSPQTAIYAFYTRLSNDPNGLFRLGGGEVDNALSAISRNGLSLGVRHSF